MKAYTGERPPVVSMGLIENEDDAWRQIMACVDWYAALPDAVTYALDRLFRRIDAIFGRYACFQAPAGPVDDKTERAPRVLTVHPRRGTTATLRFEPDATRPGSGLMLRICDDANPDPLQGFMARIVTSPGAERRQAVSYDASWMGYDGPRPNISAACETEADLIKIADHLIRFVARHAAR